jgi:Aerotolerance regulator N-terminal
VSFVFPMLLGGLALVGIPVLIHLIMRQKPRVLPFPAFRFLVQRHRANLRKLRLRHVLLLALRMLILAAICLALARPRAFSEGLGLGGDRPLAAVLLFDTSYSMEYAITGGQSRLDEAKKRGVELVDDLPEGSRVAILDTAESISTGKGQWLSLAQARERIGALHLRHDSGSVTSRLENAYRLLGDLARNKQDEAAAKLPRFLCVLSDRTRACWDAAQLPRLYDASDPIPPPLERLRATRDDFITEATLLRELRQRLPPPGGQDYPEQALIEQLQQVHDRAPSVQGDDYPDPELSKALTGVRSRSRQLIGLLEQRGDQVPAEAKEYRDQVLASLRAGLKRLRGVHEVFIDVGVENPTDLALVDVELPLDSGGQRRQVFAADEKIILRAMVQATGKEYTTNVLCQVGAKKEQRGLSLKAGERQVAAFEIDAAALRLEPGPHQAEVRLATPDLLAFDNVRFVTFAIREPRRVLLLTDDERKAKDFADALVAMKQFTPEVRTVGSIKQPGELARYQAVFLLGVARPDANVWPLLDEYVRRGGGLGIVPGGAEMDASAYKSGPAQQVMPGQIGGVVSQKEPGATWDLTESVFQHPLIKPFRAWQINRVDFIQYPRYATHYWDVTPAERSTVVVTYADDKHRPALLERQAGNQTGRPGRVLLFTTPLDGRQDPHWNNYLESLTSFYVVLTHLSTSYLAGDAAEVQLNFLSGQTVPTVALPLALRYLTYTVNGPGGADVVPAAEGQNTLTLPKAVAPGNYTVDGPDGKRVAAFSVNLPPDECVLTRVPAAEIEALFGPGAVVPVERRGSLREALQGHWSQPVELFPVLMIALLLALAIENLLANKFYRREDLTTQDTKDTK